VATLYLALICFPEALSFFYGVISDTVTIFGSQRRAYILIMALIQTAMGAIIAKLTFVEGEQTLFAFLVFILIFSRAWLAPVIETLMVI
jgi:hypothetical protein